MKAVDYLPTLNLVCAKVALDECRDDLRFLFEGGVSRVDKVIVEKIMFKTRNDLVKLGFFEQIMENGVSAIRETEAGRNTLALLIPGH